MKDVELLTVDELVNEVQEMRALSQSATGRANQCEKLALSRFLKENKLNGNVRYKLTKNIGRLQIEWDKYRERYTVKFHQLKKNGDPMVNYNFVCTVYDVYDNLSENFIRLLNSYEPQLEE